MVWGFLSSCSNYSTCAINHVHDLKNLIQGLIKNWKNSKEHSFHIFYIKIWPSFKTWPPTHKYLYTDGVDVKLHLNIIPGHGLDSFLFQWIKFFHPDDSVPMNNIYFSSIPMLVPYLSCNAVYENCPNGGKECCNSIQTNGPVSDYYKEHWL